MKPPQKKDCKCTSREWCDDCDSNKTYNKALKDMYKWIDSEEVREFIWERCEADDSRVEQICKMLKGKK